VKELHWTCRRYALTAWFSRKRQTHDPPQQRDNQPPSPSLPDALPDFPDPTSEGNPEASTAAAAGFRPSLPASKPGPYSDANPGPCPEANPTAGTPFAQASSNISRSDADCSAGPTLTKASSSNSHSTSHSTHRQTDTAPLSASTVHHLQHPHHEKEPTASVSSQANANGTNSDLSTNRLNSHSRATTSHATPTHQQDDPCTQASHPSQGHSRASSPSQHRKLITKPGCIFVSIAAYRDPECQWTMCDLFKQADAPDVVTVGVVWQIDAVEDAAFVRVAGASKRHRQVRELPVGLTALNHQNCFVYLPSVLTNVYKDASCLCAAEPYPLNPICSQRAWHYRKVVQHGVPAWYPLLAYPCKS